MGSLSTSALLFPHFINLSSPSVVGCQSGSGWWLVVKVCQAMTHSSFRMHPCTGLTIGDWLCEGVAVTNSSSHAGHLRAIQHEEDSPSVIGCEGVVGYDQQLFPHVEHLWAIQHEEDSPSVSGCEGVPGCDQQLLPHARDLRAISMKKTHHR